MDCIALRHTHTTSLRCHPHVPTFEPCQNHPLCPFAIGDAVEPILIGSDFLVLDFARGMLRSLCFLRGRIVELIRPYLEKLVGLAHADGGWSYRPDQPARLEPTCLALLALSQEGAPFQEAIDRGWAVVRNGALADGAYRLPGDREEAIWTTALVLFLKAATGQGKADVEQTVARLLVWKGRNPDPNDKGEVHDIDLKLLGWPWAENNFSWV